MTESKTSSTFVSSIITVQSEAEWQSVLKRCWGLDAEERADGSALLGGKCVTKADRDFANMVTADPLFGEILFDGVVQVKKTYYVSVQLIQESESRAQICCFLFVCDIYIYIHTGCL
jgi:hypothetical protein